MPTSPEPLLGRSDERGHAWLKIKVYGLSPTFAREFEAMIDTGFTGFLTLPLIEALPLGLVLSAAEKARLANGTSMDNLVCIGNVDLGNGDVVTGQILLGTGETPLLGMGFLKACKRMLCIMPEGFVLFDIAWLAETMAAALKKATETGSTPTPPVPPQT
jgi:predicted aspartyl protease